MLVAALVFSAVFLVMLMVPPFRVVILDILTFLWEGIQTVFLLIAVGLTAVAGGLAGPTTRAWLRTNLSAAWARLKIAAQTTAVIFIIFIIVLIGAARYGDVQTFAVILCILSVPIMILFGLMNALSGSFIGRALGMDRAYGLGLLLAFMWFVGAMLLLLPASMSSTVGWLLSAVVLVAGLFYIIGALTNRRTLIPHWTLAIAGALMLFCSVIGTAFAQDVRVMNAIKKNRDIKKANEAMVLEMQTQGNEIYVAKNGGTPAYKGWYFDLKGNRVNSLGEPATADDLNPIPTSPGSTQFWYFNKWDKLMTRTALMEDAVMNGQLMIPVLREDAQKRFVKSKDIFWVIARETTVGNREVEPDPGWNIATPVTTSAPAATPIPAATPTPAPAPTVTAAYTFTVPANQPWFNTGLDVSGKQIRIRYVSGRWSNSPGTGAIFSDADGVGTWRGLVLPTAPFRALIGKINGSPFLVGNLYEGAPGGGILQLGMNDTFAGGGYGDNQGDLTIAVEFLN